MWDDGKVICGREGPRGPPASLSTNGADERQAEVLPLIFGGRAGGFLGFVATLFPEGREFRGAERARITYEVAPDRAQRGTEIAGKVRAWAKALTGPTSLPGKYPQLMNPPGSETGPGQLVTWGKSLVCSVDAFGFKFQYNEFAQAHSVRLDRSGTVRTA